MTEAEFRPVSAFLEAKRGALTPFFVALPQYNTPSNSAWVTDLGNHTFAAASTHSPRYFKTIVLVTFRWFSVVRSVNVVGTEWYDIVWTHEIGEFSVRRDHWQTRAAALAHLQGSRLGRRHRSRARGQVAVHHRDRDAQGPSCGRAPQRALPPGSGLYSATHPASPSYPSSEPPVTSMAG